VRPLIGIPPVHDDRGRLSPGRATSFLDVRYARAVETAGAAPVLLPLQQDAAALVDRLDGLLLPGGGDFVPERSYPAGVEFDAASREQLAFDTRVLARALERGIPVLGVCYGMQLLALVGGGTLLQHLPEDRPGAQPHAGGAVHPVRVAPAAKLAGMLRVESIDVVSRHHQAVAGVGADWRVGASDDEGLIEAVEHCSHPFAVGVQWHPELSGAGLPGGPRHAELFRALVDAARSHREARAARREAGALAP
jgi:putative glutamine amidotransferase